jgi:hypothetical protein
VHSKKKRPTRKDRRYERGGSTRKELRYLYCKRTPSFNRCTRRVAFRLSPGPREVTRYITLPGATLCNDDWLLMRTSE